MTCNSTLLVKHLLIYVTLFVSTALLYYSFDASTIYGSTVTNLGSGGSTYNAVLVNDAIITNTVTEKTVGTDGLQLISSRSQYVMIPPFVTGNAGVSFAFWFKFSSSYVNSRVFEFGNGIYHDRVGFALESDYDCYMVCYTGTTPHSAPSLLGFYQYPGADDGVWRHFALTVDTGSNIVVYLNGDQVYLTSGLNPQNVLRSNNYLGKSNGGEPYMNGGIDEFYMFQYVLSLPQVQAMYAEGGKGRSIFALIPSATSRNLVYSVSVFRLTNTDIAYACL